MEICKQYRLFRALYEGVLYSLHDVQSIGGTGLLYVGTAMVSASARQ